MSLEDGLDLEEFKNREEIDTREEILDKLMKKKNEAVKYFGKVKKNPHTLLKRKTLWKVDRQGEDLGILPNTNSELFSAFDEEAGLEQVDDEATEEAKFSDPKALEEVIQSELVGLDGRSLSNLMEEAVHGAYLDIQNSESVMAMGTESMRPSNSSKLKQPLERSRSFAAKVSMQIGNQIGFEEEECIFVLRTTALFLIATTFQAINVLMVVVCGILMATSVSFSDLVANFISIEVIVRVPEAIPKLLMIKDQSPERKEFKLGGLVNEKYKNREKTIRVFVYICFLIVSWVTYSYTYRFCKDNYMRRTQK